jgi:hypothetical protein
MEAKEDWFALREIVMAATDGVASPLIPLHRHDPAVRAVIEYLADRSRAQLLDDAAKNVALRKPGVSQDVAVAQYWLVLDNS